jgi:hypothetical protein
MHLIDAMRAAVQPGHRRSIFPLGNEMRTSVSAGCRGHHIPRFIMPPANKTEQNRNREKDQRLAARARPTESGSVPEENADVREWRLSDIRERIEIAPTGRRV